jgi:hypothetical protein
MVLRMMSTHRMTIRLALRRRRCMLLGAVLSIRADLLSQGIIQVGVFVQSVFTVSSALCPSVISGSGRGSLMSGIAEAETQPVTFVSACFQ